jgi:predicted dehydrogenase
MTRSTPLRAGFIGAGFIADYHAAVVRALGGIDLDWVSDPDVRRAEGLHQKWGFRHFATSAAELLAQSPPDVVHVLVPPPLHATVVEMCVRAGAHVLVEKPFAISTAECQALIDAAATQGVTIGVNHNGIYQPAFTALVEEIRRRELGQVQHVTATWNVALPQLDARQFDHWMFAHPRNILLEQAVHPLSQIQFLLGDIERVSAQSGAGTTLPTGGRFVDEWQVSLICTRGTAQCFLGFGHGFYDHWLHVIGEDGAAIADLRRNTLRVTSKSRFIEPVDNVVDGWRSGVALVRSTTSDFAAYVAAFLKFRGRQDAFYRSMDSSIRAFYAATSCGIEPPASAAFGAKLVKACEDIAEAVQQTVHSETMAGVK